MPESYPHAREGFLHGRERDAAFYARRAGLSGAIIAGHVMLFLWVLYWSGLAATPKPMRQLVSFDISAAAKPSAPARKARVPRVAPERMVQALRPESTVSVPPTASGSGSGAGCAMAAAIARAITENPDAMAALAALPPDLRTEADAVMLWNGEWTPDDEPSLLSFFAPEHPPEHPMEPLKQVVMATLRAAPLECQDTEVTGPQLIPVAEPGRTTMLVVGSGNWRWSALLDPLYETPVALQELAGEGLWPLVFPPTGN